METTTCQICGRPIKANTGKIAHHGYKRPHEGFQTRSCLGARHLPYEESNDAIQPAIDRLSAWKRQQELSLEGFIANPPDTLIIPWRNKTVQASRPTVYSEYRESMPNTYEYGFRKITSALKNGIEGATRDIEYLTKRLADWKAPVKA